MKNVYQIREVSTLLFNERVLQEAEDSRNPLMERLKFLGIFSSNMDEFFKVRVAGIQRRVAVGKKGVAAVLDVLGQKTRELDERFRAAYASIMGALAKEGIRVLTEQDVVKGSGELVPWLREYFQDNVLPKLVPIIIHKGQPFPQIRDGALYFGVEMKRGEGKAEKARYALLEIPSEVPRFVELPNGNIMYVDDVIRFSLNEVFYIFEYDHIAAYEFKISRDAEIDVEDDFAEGYLSKMERGLQKRKKGRPTRLVCDEEMPASLVQLLRKELNISRNDTIIAGGRYHNMRDLMRFPCRRTDLAFQKVEPANHPVIDRDKAPLLDIIRRRDILITYPYQSFDYLIRLLREAAIDPKVKEIKMTLYRTARSSQVVNALFNAAQNGKKILVSIELQARFDERQNIETSERLSEVGARVVYGVPPMKTHSKLLLIQRENTLFAGLSTGNFNEDTGRLYVDSTLLTTDARLVSEVADVFEFLEDAARMRMLKAPKFKHLLVSPFNARKGVMKLLAREMNKGKDGYVFIKVNHLVDPKIMDRIREAADAGVHFDLVVRTTYGMLPHPNIRAVSILDRYLEHQRVYIFGKGEDRHVFMSSADLMSRNLDQRIEVGFPIYDTLLKREVIGMMALQLADTFKARILDETQSNRYVSTRAGGQRVQVETQRYFERLYEEAEKAPSLLG